MVVCPHWGVGLQNQAPVDRLDSLSLILSILIVPFTFKHRSWNDITQLYKFKLHTPHFFTIRKNPNQQKEHHDSCQFFAGSLFSSKRKKPKTLVGGIDIKPWWKMTWCTSWEVQALIAMAMYGPFTLVPMSCWHVWGHRKTGRVGCVEEGKEGGWLYHVVLPFFFGKFTGMFF